MIKVLMAPLIVLLIASATHAEQGLFLGAGIVFNDIGGDINAGKAIASGSGVIVRAGYGFHKNVALEASVWKTDHVVNGGRSIDFKAATIGVKLLFPIVNSHIEPYLAAGVGKYMFDTMSGDGWNYGAGILIHLFPSLDFSVGLTRSEVGLGSSPRTHAEVTGMDFGVIYRFL